MNMTPTIALPYPNLLIGFLNWINQSYLFAAEEADDDDISDDDEDAFDDDSEIFGADDDDDSDDDDEEDKDDEEEDDEDEDDDDDKDDKKSKKSKKSDKSAIIQKKRYRDRLAKAKAKIKKLESGEGKEEDLSDDQKKEKAAEEFLANKIRDVLKGLQEEESSMTDAQQEAFDDEMEEVLDENDHLTEKQILKVTKELDVSPKKALKVIERERKLSKRAKPNLPKEKRASTKVTKKDDVEEKATRPTLDSIARGIKDKLKSGDL